MKAPFATWRPSPNRTVGGMTPQPDGVVLHIEQGSDASCQAWFQSPASQVSAHFSVSKLGAISQYVDTGDAAWAEAAGNARWISIEHEGVAGDSLTGAQITADATILAWLKDECGMHFPLTLTDQPGTPGIGWHGMGGAAWGNHPDCPGDPVKAQRPLIIAATLAILDPQPTPEVPVDFPQIWHDATRQVAVGVPGCRPFLVPLPADGSEATGPQEQWPYVGPWSSAMIDEVLKAGAP